MLWTEKYEPKEVSEIAGNAEALKEITKWAEEWQNGKKPKALFLVGGTGTGKTAVVHALARQMEWDLSENNAAEARSGEELQRKTGHGIASLYAFEEKERKRLIFYDEADCLKQGGAEGEDRGAMAVILRAIKENDQPIIVAANDAYAGQAMAALRATTKIVKFKAVNWSSIQSALRRICEKEKVAVEGEKLKEIAIGNRGDVRAAITDLQALAALPEAEYGHGKRERTTDPFNAVKEIFKSESYSDAMKAADSADVDLEMLLMWLGENIPLEYEKKAEMAKAMEWMARASIFRGRIRRRQNWKLLKYAKNAGVGGTAASREERYGKFSMYKFPSLISVLSQSKKQREELGSAAEKIAGKIGESKRRTLLEMHFYAVMLRDKDAKRHFGLEKAEAEAVEKRAGAL